MIDDGREWRGGQRQTLLLARGLKKRGIDVMLACHPNGELAGVARREKVSAWEINMRGEWDAMAAWRLGNLTEEVDLLHAQTAHAHTIALLAVRIGYMRPVIVHRRVDFEPSTGPFSRWKYRSADRFIAISGAVASALIRSGVSNDKVSVVHSGIDPAPVENAPKVDLRDELGLKKDTPLVGNVAQLVDHKGHRYLIDAVPMLKSKIPDIHVAIAGDGPLMKELAAQAQKKGVQDRVHLLGYRKDIPSILGSFDVFVMSSHLEGMGTAILDAFAARTPVAAAAAGGIPEMIAHGVEGLLFKPKDPAALADAAARIIKEPGLSKKLAQGASERLKRNFTADCMVDGVCGVYKEVLS